MSGVDNRIVTMQFNNSQFESNAKTSLSTLQKLKESMNFGTVTGGAIRGLGAIQSALSKIGLKTPFGPMITMANKGLAGVGTVLDKIGLKNPFVRAVDGAGELQKAAQTAGGPAGMGVLEGGVTSVSAKFIALTTIAITALTNITNKAISSTTQWLKSFTLQPIMDGLHEYQTNLQAIQTVQANTDRPLPEINKALQQLNTYSDQTIYNFSEMAKNVGTFTAAGVDLNTSVSAIKGIANMAALSGSNSQQAATAMYQLSQALASGKVGLQDWNSVVNAGMGGKKLQNALAQTAIAMGKIDAAQVKGTKSGEQLKIAGQSFRESIMAKPGAQSWLTSDILKNALATLDGRFSAAALSQEKLKNGTLKYKSAAEVTAQIDKNRADLAKKGVKYTDEQFAALEKLSTAAFKSATEVKTLGQVFDIAKETIGSGWSASFQNIFGNLKQAKELFTGMSNGLNKIINANALARNNVLAAWAKGGGRALMIDGLKDAWKSFYSIIQAVSKGFRQVFPKKTADDLIHMSGAFSSFLHSLLPGQKTLQNISKIAAGVASVFDIVWQVLKGVGTAFKTMFASVGAGNGNFLDFAGHVGDLVTRFDLFLKSSGVITAFFTSLGHILSVPLALLKGLGAIISGLFTGFDSGTAKAFGDTFDNVGKHLTGVETIGKKLSGFFSNLGSIFGRVGKVIGSALVGIGDTVAKLFTPETFQSTLAVINTSLLGGIVLLIRNFFQKGVKIDLTGGLFDGIKQTLGEATSAFTTMQQNLKANILMKLAAAIGVMALALLVLSGIDPGALSKALAAMTGGFAILIGTMAAMLKVLGPAGIVQLYVISSAMTKMALSILLLALALKTLAGIKFGDMLRGLVGLSAMMFIMSKVMPVLAGNSKGMAKASYSMILMGVALNILAVALKIFASMSWEEMAKGLIMLAGTLGVLALAFKIMPDMKAEGLGLIALGIAMNLLAIALKVFATMSLAEMGKSLLMLAGSLAIIAIAINAMPKTMLLQAAGLLVVATAMTVLAAALKVLGGMGWSEMAKGLIMMAASLLIIGLALKLYGASGVLGAAALLITAAAMTTLLPVLLAFGAMKWSTILKSLTMLAAIFVILGAAGYLLAPVVLVIMGLGAALLLMGAGLALAGAGALAAATAFGIVVAAGAAGIQILVGLLAAIIAAIPPAMAAFAKGVVQFAIMIGAGAPAIAAAFGQVLINLLDQAIKAVPKMGQLFLTLINTGARVVIQGAPRIASAGVALILALLNAIGRNIGKIADSATRIVVNFITALGRNLPKIIDAGFKFIISFVNGTADAIRKNRKPMEDAGKNLASAIISGIVHGLGDGAKAIKDAAVSAAKGAFNAAKDFLGIGGPSKLMQKEVGYRMSQGVAVGVKSGTKTVVNEISDLGAVSVSKMSEAMQQISDAVALDPNLNPTISPVLDLAALTKEANKMSAILATAPIMAAVSYQTAADISAMTQANPGDGGDNGSGGGGDQYVTLEQHLHSPKPIDSVESYRAGKTLISLAKEALK